jgi:hypothetical protein
MAEYREGRLWNSPFPPARVKEFKGVLKEELYREENSEIDRLERGAKNEDKPKKKIAEMDGKWKEGLRPRAPRN